MAQWAITNNILPEVAAEVQSAAQSVLEKAGEVFKETARDQCPISAVADKDYVHLRDTIDYAVGKPTSYGEQEVTFYVEKDYASYVNNGTKKMKARPFFTNGVLKVEDNMDAIVASQFASLIAGRVSGKR